jgi:hypothetical protein
LLLSSIVLPPLPLLRPTFGLSPRPRPVAVCPFLLLPLLHEAGLIEAIDLGSHDGVYWRPKHLTYAGNEFLAAA